MKTLIKKSCRQLKRLKKMRQIAVMISQCGLLVTCVGYIGFFLTLVKITGPALMLTTFAFGVPMMIVGALANELAIYQEIRLRSKFQKYTQMVQTILHRYDGQNTEKAEPVCQVPSGHHSMICSGV